jgi:hypothetical protein
MHCQMLLELKDLKEYRGIFIVRFSWFLPWVHWFKQLFWPWFTFTTWTFSATYSKNVLGAGDQLEARMFGSRQNFKFSVYRIIPMWQIADGNRSAKRW